MKQRGRKSSAQLTTAATVQNIPRVPPPAELTEFEAHVWASVVNTKPADWFQADTIALLLSYCKHISHAQTIDKQIVDFDSGWLADDDGLKRYKTLTEMRDRESRAMTALARSMRLTHQSQIQPTTASIKANKGAGKKPWEA